MPPQGTGTHPFCIFISNSKLYLWQEEIRKQKGRKEEIKGYLLCVWDLSTRNDIESALELAFCAHKLHMGFSHSASGTDSHSLHSSIERTMIVTKFYFELYNKQYISHLGKRRQRSISKCQRN